MVNFIICEFNPFHNGHAWLLRQLTDAPKVCIMSSHITQRGEFSVCDKWARTEMALHGGADLVLELPAPFAMGNAEKFALGAVTIAKALGVEGRLCFGTEGENVLPRLKQIAKISEQSLSPIVKELLSEGYSYAVAKATAYQRLAPESADLIATPNNMLALEYIKAAPDMPHLAFSRQGVSHDAALSQGVFCSASALRNDMQSYQKFTPPSVHHIYERLLSQHLLPDTDKTDLLMLHSLRTLSHKDWMALSPDGIGVRFYKAIQNAATLTEVLDAVKTKCCTYASLRRIAMKAFLGESPTEKVPYIRILGANACGRELLSHLSPTLPVITKPASVKTLDDTANQLMEYESRLTDHYMFLLPKPEGKGKEFSTSPIMI